MQVCMGKYVCMHVYVCTHVYLCVCVLAVTNKVTFESKPERIEGGRSVVPP